MLLSHAFLRLPARRFGAALLFSLLFVLAPVHAAPPPLVLNAKSVLVVNQRTGKTLYQKQPNRVLPIASITKLMTAMV
ncbi:TPA: peptidase S11, partial [Serratia marcescens]|nr:peptidase S11 [Serratia marcescens]HEJ7199737.1 peptidase S11 [Serratia marcescens]